MALRRRFDIKGYMAAQTEQVLSPLNRYYAGCALGRDPTVEDCWRHWCASRAAECFRKEYQAMYWVLEEDVPSDDTASVSNCP